MPSRTGLAVSLYPRLGGLLCDFSILFQPRSIVLAGGVISAHSVAITRAVEEELAESLPDNYERPAIIVSPFGQVSALIGAATMFA